MLLAGIVLCMSLLGAHARVDADGCGQRPLAPTARVASPRIIGGTESVPYSWPFMCSIEDTFLHAHICGASLVKSKTGNFFLLTAAHCVSSAMGNADRYKVWCSVHNIVDNDPQAQLLQLSRIRVHPYFNHDMHNDLAILELAVQPQESDSLQAVCLPTMDHAPAEMATLLGWGHTSEGGVSSPVLLEGRKPILADTQCEAAYGPVFSPVSMLCAGLLGSGTVDACAQDSGAPLMVQRNGSYELVGVVSWGYGCGHPQYPGVYSDVWTLLYWITTVINA